MKSTKQQEANAGRHRYIYLRELIEKWDYPTYLELLCYSFFVAAIVYEYFS